MRRVRRRCTRDRRNRGRGVDRWDDDAGRRRFGDGWGVRWRRRGHHGRGSAGAGAGTAGAAGSVAGAAGAGAGAGGSAGGAGAAGSNNAGSGGAAGTTTVTGSGGGGATGGTSSGVAGSAGGGSRGGSSGTTVGEVPLDASLMSRCTGSNPIRCTIPVASNGNYNVTVELGGRRRFDLARSSRAVSHRRPPRSPSRPERTRGRRSA